MFLTMDPLESDHMRGAESRHVIHTRLTVEQVIAHAGKRTPVLAEGMLRTPEQVQAALDLGLPQAAVGAIGLWRADPSEAGFRRPRGVVHSRWPVVSHGSGFGVDSGAQS